MAPKPGGAEIEPGASVGRGTSIAASTRVRSGARIGDDSTIDADVLIDADVVIGDRVRIQDRALLYLGTTVEDEVLVGPGVIITNDRQPRAVTTSADLAAAGDGAGSVRLRRGSTIGAGAIIIGGLAIGEFAVVAAGAVVIHDVPGHALVAGNPAARLGWVCSCGMRLVDDDGLPAGPEPPHYARHPELRCPSCDRVYAYVPDADSLEERIVAGRLPA
jgi:UDP-2-acetamido-3-amino-2,3-dideoxy-glucuronate N-acetyltransferase